MRALLLPPLIFTLLLLPSSHTFSIYQMMNVTHYLLPFAKISKTNAYTSKTTLLNTRFAKYPNLTNYVRLYPNRTALCDHHCTISYDLRCHFIFGCNIHLRNLVLMIFGPLIIFGVLATCCRYGIWSANCVFYYLFCTLGIVPLVKMCKFVARKMMKRKMKKIQAMQYAQDAQEKEKQKEGEVANSKA